MVAGLVVRDAVEADIGVLHRFVMDLARYEQLEHETVVTVEDLNVALFRPPPAVYALICEWDGEPVGSAIWFYSFSTFEGRRGIYVEDVFVDPAFRGRGIGRAVFTHLARRAVADGCHRMEWMVLDWNAPSIAFYEGLGARKVEGWHVRRLVGPDLRLLAQGR